MNLNRRGLIGTITTHGLVLLLLLLGGLTFPDPPPEEEGILVNFGTDDSGFGQFEPAGRQQEAVPDQSEQDIPEVEESYVPEASVPEVTEVDNTQDVEEVKVKEDPQPTEEEIRKAQEEAERIRKQQEEEERIRQEEEAERIRQEQLEAERKRRDEQANRINQLGQNTFGNTGAGGGDESQGETSGTGNQGVETGSPNASNYGDGAGLGNNRYGLGDRKVNGELIKPVVDECNVTSRTTIKVAIQVDRDGNVVRAEVDKADYADDCLWKSVIDAATRTKFTADQTALVRQAGWIVYTIEP